MAGAPADLCRADQYFFGIDIPSGASAIDTLRYLSRGLDHINPYATAVGASTLLAGILCRRFAPRFPFMIAAMIAGGAAAALFNAISSESRASIAMVEALPGSLPPDIRADFSLDTVRKDPSRRAHQP